MTRSVCRALVATVVLAAVPRSAPAQRPVASAPPTAQQAAASAAPVQRPPPTARQAAASAAPVQLPVANAAGAAAHADSSARAAIELAARARVARKLTGKYDPWFRKYSKRYFGANFDWKLFKAQGVAESELNPNAVSPVGARGLMQVMPATFAAIASHQRGWTSIDSPEWNIATGIIFDRDLWRRWEPDVAPGECARFAFASYNAGDGTISRAVGVARGAQLDPTVWTSVVKVAPTVKRWRHQETLGYVRKIEGTYQVLKTVR